jgi:hypothetical protein
VLIETFEKLETLVLADILVLRNQILPQARNGWCKRKQYMVLKSGWPLKVKNKNS